MAYLAQRTPGPGPLGMDEGEVGGLPTNRGLGPFGLPAGVSPAGFVSPQQNQPMMMFQPQRPAAFAQQPVTQVPSPFLQAIRAAPQVTPVQQPVTQFPVVQQQPKPAAFAQQPVTQFPVVQEQPKTFAPAQKIQQGPRTFPPAQKIQQEPRAAGQGTPAVQGCVPATPPSKSGNETCNTLRKELFAEERTRELKFDDFVRNIANPLLFNNHRNKTEYPDFFTHMPSGNTIISGTTSENLQNPHPSSTWSATVPTIKFEAGRIVMRGTASKCNASKTQYGFNKSVWWSYDVNNDVAAEYETTKAYAGQSGCVIQYQVPEGGMLFLDFWDSRVMMVILFWIYKKKLTQREIDVFQYYTGFGIPNKDRIVDMSSTRGKGATMSELMKYGWECGLLDTKYETDDFYYSRYRPRKPVPKQFDRARYIRWGSDMYDFDHSSMREMDQEFSSLLNKIFNERRTVGETTKFDGVIIPFEAPSSMHTPGIHPEFFTFPCKAKKLIHMACKQCGTKFDGSVGCSVEPQGCTMQQGAKRKTRRRNQKKSKTQKRGKVSFRT